MQTGSAGGILIVAGSPNVGARLARDLAATGRVITVTRSCSEARTALDTVGCLDLTVLDGALCDDSATGLAETTRAKHPCSEVIILAASPPALTGAAQTALGTAEWVRLPLDDGSGLLTAAQNALGRARQQREHATQLASLRDGEQRYRLAMQANNEGMWDWDITNNVVYYSDRWKEMLGLAQIEVGVGLDEWLGRVHPQDREVLQSALDAHLNGEEPFFWCEYRVKHADLGYRWCLARGMALRGATGRPVRCAGTQSDITEKKWAMEQLVYDAVHDPVTGLPNRTLLADRIERAVAQQESSSTGHVVVVALDTERFHLLRDALGDDAARRILYGIGERITETLGLSTTVGNLGGQRFAILLENVGGVKDATETVQRVRDSFNDPFDVCGRDVHLSFAVGIVCPERGSGRTGDEIIRDAEIAMGHAKRQGKGTHVVFKEEMRRRTVSLLELDVRLRRALERDEFMAYYQPIVTARTQDVEGVEALARWRTCDGQVHPPAVFLTRAVDNGLISEIERRLFRSACSFVAGLARRTATGRAVCLSVNVSADRLWKPDLVKEVADVLSAVELPPECVKLELLESILMSEPRQAVRRIEELKEVGVLVGIDDFGTGYSSLSYLHRLPLDFVKIDQTFVSSLESDPKVQELVRAILGLADNLGLTAIAEGVETRAQADYLTHIGCGLMQGFLFSRPVCAEALVGLLQNNPLSLREPRTAREP